MENDRWPHYISSHQGERLSQMDDASALWARTQTISRAYNALGVSEKLDTSSGERVAPINKNSVGPV